MHDLRFASRQLLKSPGFAAVAIVSLALGIGANTAIFSLVNDFLLRSLPVKNPEELVLFRAINGAQGPGMSRSQWGNSYPDPVTGFTTGTSFSLLMLQRFGENHPALTDVFGFMLLTQPNLLVDGVPEVNAPTQLVSGGYFRGLGLTPLIGRLLTNEDDQPSSPPVIVISDRYWQNRFGRDPAILGRTIHLNTVPVTIVGVTPPGFNGTGQVGENVDVHAPLGHYAKFMSNHADLTPPGTWWIRIMGRLAPGFTAAQVRASMEPLFQQAALEGWEAGRSRDTTPRATPAMPVLAVDPGAQGETNTRRQYRRSMHMLMGLVSLVLLAACANVANLLLARGAARRREIAVRLALGASRARIVRQLLAESLLLAGLGAALGTLLAWWSRGALLALRPFGNATVVLDLPLDGRVLGFTIAVAIGTAVLFGLAPALRATRLDLNAEFQGGSRGLGGGRSRLAQALMVVQIALSLVLLVSTALFVRTLQNIQQVDAGFNRRQLVLFRIDTASAGYKRDQSPGIQMRVLERLQHLPGVKAATFSSIPLLNRGRWNTSVTIPGYTPPAGASMSVHMNALAPNFLEAMEMPLLLGRSFTGHDDAAAPKVVIVNQTFAKKYFGDENPIGRRIIAGNPAGAEIIGVVRDAKYTSLRDPVAPTVYRPALENRDGVAHFAVRAAGDPVALFNGIRAAVREIDPALPVFNLRTQDEQLERNHSQERLFARLSGFFGVLALALACVGLHGLMSYTVTRRTGEIGLRMALGALPGHVLRMILKESLALVCLGVVIGLTGAWFASRLVATLLFGLSPTDPFTYALAACLLIAIALFASLLPARRAARVEPMTALRAE
jgi:predicted permease